MKKVCCVTQVSDRCVYTCVYVHNMFACMCSTEETRDVTMFI